MRPPKIIKVFEVLFTYNGAFYQTEFSAGTDIAWTDDGEITLVFHSVEPGVQFMGKGATFPDAIRDLEAKMHSIGRYLLRFIQSSPSTDNQNLWDHVR